MVKKASTVSKKALVKPKKIASQSIPDIPFEGRLASPDATAFLPSFGTFSFSITMDATLDKGRVNQLGFVTEGPLIFKRLLSRSCAAFLGKSEDEVEFFTFDIFFQQLNPNEEERDYALYAWTAVQDVCGRLPFADPLSKAIGKIRFLNREFKHGTLLPDLED